MVCVSKWAAVDFPVLKTKLFIPPLLEKMVPRPRLYQQIEGAIHAGCRLILTAAPAGFGKTTVISTWVHQQNKHVAWLSLDERDNEPTIFWVYIIITLQTICPDFCDTLLEKLTAAGAPATNNFLPELVNELTSLDHPVTLVLDDYHVISNQEIHADLAFLLNHQPPQLHLVIATRADPPLPIARLRAQRAILELRVKDLRFTPEEARTFLNEINQLDLTLEEISLLEQRTEGWVVGLVLAALSIQGRRNKGEFIAAFSGSHQYVLEYLLEEVINQRPQVQREFLLKTSILGRFCGPLCDAVIDAPGSTHTLEQLYKENLFIIPLDAERTWYRYHHLFGDLLTSQLHKEYTQDEIQNLHLRASRWYQQADQFDPAVRYALSGKDYERAADLIEQAAGRTIARGLVKTLLQWIQALPEEVLIGHPILLMRQGWAVFLSGRVSQASRILMDSQNAIMKMAAGEKRNRLQGQLSAMLATLTALTRDLPTAIAQAEEALADLPEEEVIYRARAMRVLGVCHTFLGNLDQATSYLEEAGSLALRGQNRFLAAEIFSQIATARKHQGKLKQAFATYQRILNLYNIPEENPPACLGYIGMAEIALEWNDPEAAQKYLDTGIELGTQGSIGYALQPAFLIQGLLRYAQGDEAGALEAVAQGEKLSRTGGGSLESILGLAIFQARLCLLLGEVGRAKSWATGERLPPGWSFENLPVVLQEIQQSLLARVYLRTGAPEKTLAIADSQFEQVREGGRNARLLELSLYKALALQQLGRGAKALESLRDSLMLAEPEGYQRLFVEAGAPVRNLLRQVAAQGSYAEYAARLISVIEADPIAAQQAPTRRESMLGVETLTGRELVVLQLICEGYSNQQIAEALILSVNTVKKHTSNIYGKLGVRNRAQAAIRAQEIGLV
jgi:LuxR family maltose regulon positive regulatory protein